MFLHVRQRSPVDAPAPVDHRVARLVAYGHPYKEEANRLDISAVTVRNLLHSVYRNHGIRNKAMLARCLGEDGMG